MGIVNKKCQNIGQILDIGKQFALPVKVVFTGKVVKWFYRFFTGKLPVKSPHYLQVLATNFARCVLGTRAFVSSAKVEENE